MEGRARMGAFFLPWGTLYGESLLQSNGSQTLGFLGQRNLLWTYSWDTLKHEDMRAMDSVHSSPS